MFNLTRDLYYPLYDLIKHRHLTFYYKRFEKNLSYSKSQIEEIQFSKLKKLINYAYYNTKFYNEHLNSKRIKPTDIRKIKDLEKIPTVRRDHLQKFWQEIIPKKKKEKKLYKGTSSGSTGVPVVYYKDSKAESAGQAGLFIGWKIAGWQPGMKGLHIWGNPTIVNYEWQKIGSKLKAWLFNHHKFAAFKLTDSNEFYALYEILNKSNYEFIDGYTNAIYLFASFLTQNNLSLSSKIKRVFPTAENLQLFQRRIIEEQLGPVYDTYGCSEINGIANECEYCHQYHIIDPHVVVEFGDVIDDQGSHKIIITDLDNYAFPLIRYENDDLAIPYEEKDENKCPLPFSRLSKIIGRESDIIYFPNGGTLTVPSFFGSMLLKKVNGIKQYQIIREFTDKLNVLFVVDNNFSKEDMKIIENSLDEYLENRIKYEVNIVNSIESSHSGKFKLLIDKTRV